MHGNFSRADTKNFMAAIGPDFRAKYSDPAPASNADVGMTLAHILGLKLSKKGDLMGRVLTESLKVGNRQPPQVKQLTRISELTKSGLQTVLLVQVVGNSMYFNAAGFPGRTRRARKTAAAERETFSHSFENGSSPKKRSGDRAITYTFDQGYRIAKVERLGDYRKIIWQGSVPVSVLPAYVILSLGPSKKNESNRVCAALPCEYAL